MLGNSYTKPFQNTHVHKVLSCTHQTAQWVPGACSWAHQTRALDWYRHVTSADDHHRTWRHTLSSFPTECSHHSLEKTNRTLGVLETRGNVLPEFGTLNILTSLIWKFILRKKGTNKTFEQRAVSRELGNRQMSLHPYYFAIFKSTFWK